MGAEIIVVTGAYGKQEVLAAGGQRAFLPVIEQAGADGVEIRRELFSDDELSRLPALAADIARHRLTAFYSVPDTLFTAPGVINPGLQTYFEEAAILNAGVLKLSLGYPAGDVTRQQLTAAIEACPVPIVIENDQTAGGKIAPMEDFFFAFNGIEKLQGMTFDTGNWRWIGESPEQAASRLAPYVSYIHVKVAIPHPSGFQAVPPDKHDSQWRELLAALPARVPRGIEFPLSGGDLTAVTRRYVSLLRQD